MEKIINPLVGLVLIGWLAHIGLGILFKGGETVKNRMEERAVKSREETRVKACEKTTLKFQNYSPEKSKIAIESFCTD